MRDYNIPLTNVIGHREINTLVDQQVIDAQYHTSKSCPGKLIGMDSLRLNLPRYTVVGAQPVTPVSTDTEKLRVALDVRTASSGVFSNAKDELAEFLNPSRNN